VTEGRHEQTIAELVSFEWPRLDDPRWVDHNGERVLVGVWGEGYAPLRAEPALFRKFSDLDDTEAAFADFACKYGDYRPVTREREYVGDNARGIPLMGHTLTYWKHERQLLGLVVRLWDALRASRPEDVLGNDVETQPTGGELFVCFRRPSDSVMEPIVTIPKNSSPRRVVQAALAALVSRECHANAALAVSPGQQRIYESGLRLTFAVWDLKGAMWLQLALAIDGNREYRPCAGCGDQWDATGARATRTYCSERCRQRIARRSKGGGDDGR